MNTLRYVLPHIFCLSTSVAFLARSQHRAEELSRRAGRCAAAHRHSRLLCSYHDYRSYVDTLLAHQLDPRCAPRHVRPDAPLSLPTLVIRIFDMMPYYRDVLAVTALVQAAVAWMVDLRQHNMSFRLYERTLIAENKWRALRYGLDGRLIDFGIEQQLPARELIRELLERVEPLSRKLQLLARTGALLHHARTGRQCGPADRRLARQRRRLPCRGGLSDCRNGENRMSERPSLTIGIEEEYQIIDPETRQLAFVYHPVSGWRQGGDGRARPQTGTAPVHGGTGHARLSHAGPDQRGTDQTAPLHRPGWPQQKGWPWPPPPRTRLALAGAAGDAASPAIGGVLEEMQVLAQRLLIFGMHVHIGIDDPAFAIDTMNVVRYMLPHICWLSAQAAPSGWAQDRAQELPRGHLRGLPPQRHSRRLPHRADWDNLIGTLVRTRAACPTAAKSGGMCRPHHKYPDAGVPGLRHLHPGGRGHRHRRLCQAIVLWLWKLRQQEHHLPRLPRDLIDENRWRAGATGMDGKMIDFGKTEEMPTRALVRELLEMIGEEIEELGIRKAYQGH
jgi:carboxylate-amine ligase